MCHVLATMNTLCIQMLALILVIVCLAHQTNAKSLQDRLPRKFAGTTDEITSATAEKPKRGAASQRPLIGILGMPVQGESPDPDHRTSNHSAYIAASYVKYVESAGARAVPIVFTWSDEEITRRFNAVNGILFPGGGADVCHGRFADVGRKLFSLARKANDAGEHFPVWGTCLGFEQLATAVSEDCDIMGTFDAEDDASPLVMTDEATSSRLFGEDNQHTARLRELAEQTPPLVMENHMSGVSMELWLDNKKLNDFFSVVSYSLDRNGTKYVSTIEARDYPIYGTQWHPEKNAFEWTTKESIPHGPEATLLTQGVANFLVSEARKNTHQPKSKEDEIDMLIYNHPVTYTYKTWPTFGFDQAYFFDGDSPKPYTEKGGASIQLE